MDLLIKNMEMPTEINHPLFIRIKSDGHIAKGDFLKGGFIETEAKAIALPEHGEKCCGNCRWCHEGHYEEEGEQSYIKRKCTNKYGLAPNYSIYEYDYCSRWEASE